jgi:hypothetical protein
MEIKIQATAANNSGFSLSALTDLANGHGADAIRVHRLSDRFRYIVWHARHEVLTYAFEELADPHDVPPLP